MEQSSNLDPRTSILEPEHQKRTTSVNIYLLLWYKRLNIFWSMSLPENITADWRRSDKQAMWLPLRLFIACLVYLKLFNRVALLLETAKAHDKNGMLYKIRPCQYRTGLASNPLKDCLSLIKDNMGNETLLTRGGAGKKVEGVQLQIFQTPFIFFHVCQWTTYIP